MREIPIHISHTYLYITYLSIHHTPILSHICSVGIRDGRRIHVKRQKGRQNLACFRAVFSLPALQQGAACGPHVSALTWQDGVGVCGWGQSPAGGPGRHCDFCGYRPEAGGGERALAAGRAPDPVGEVAGGDGAGMGGSQLFFSLNKIQTRQPNQELPLLLSPARHCCFLLAR